MLVRHFEFFKTHLKTEISNPKIMLTQNFGVIGLKKIFFMPPYWIRHFEFLFLTSFLKLPVPKTPWCIIWASCDYFKENGASRFLKLPLIFATNCVNYSFRQLFFLTEIFSHFFFLILLIIFVNLTLFTKIINKIKEKQVGA